MTRPTSVTVVAWLVIAFALIAAVGLFAESALTFRTDPPRQWFGTILGVLVTSLCGIFMLKGKNWARWVYVTWSIVVLAYALTEVRIMVLVPNAIKIVIFAFILFREPANRYFKHSSGSGYGGNGRR
ncbi:MAG: hypothetical protein R3F24_00280 [Gammaproteobacteria bacterium]